MNTIRRSDAIDALIKEYPYINPTSITDVIMRVEDAEPERKTGQWEEQEITDDKCIEQWQSAKCSVCGKWHTTPYLYSFNHYDFCPHCGARMEVEHE